MKNTFYLLALCFVSTYSMADSGTEHCAQVMNQSLYGFKISSLQRMSFEENLAPKKTIVRSFEFDQNIKTYKLNDGRFVTVEYRQNMPSKLTVRKSKDGGIEAVAKFKKNSQGNCEPLTLTQGNVLVFDSNLCGYLKAKSKGVPFHPNTLNEKWTSEWMKEWYQVHPLKENERESQNAYSVFRLCEKYEIFPLVDSKTTGCPNCTEGVSH